MSRFLPDDLTEKLRLETKAAANEYGAAKIECAVQRAKSAEGGAINPEFGADFRLAVLLQSSTFSKYVLALKKFSYVVIHREPPPELQD